MDKSQIAVSIFNKYASEYQGKFMDVSLYKASFDFFCQHITAKNAEILELACGPGNITKYLLSKRPDFQLLGTDLSSNMIALAKQNNPSADFQLMDARALDKIQKKYDGIMCGFCLPYLSMEETKQLIHDASLILNPNGLLYLSTMEDDYTKSRYNKGSQGDEIFMHYYLAKDLLKILKASSFELLKRERVRSTMTDGTKVIDLILIAKKNNSSL